MSETGHPAGAEPVGTLDALDPLRVRFVQILRLWCESPEASAEVWNMFARDLGAKDGRAALGHFEGFLRVIADQAWRAPMRHGPACRCVGADEAVLALIVARAAAGALDEAERLAALMVRPGAVEALVRHAHAFGAALEAAEHNDHSAFASRRSTWMNQRFRA